MAETLNVLSEILFQKLQKDKMVVLHSIDAKTGFPRVNAISWVYAVDPSTLRFAVDRRSRLIENLRNNPLVSVTIFAAGSIHAISGTAKMVTDALEGVPFGLACYDINIVEVRNALFHGVRIVAEPEYEKTYDKRAAEKLDGQVFAAMKKA